MLLEDASNEVVIEKLAAAERRTEQRILKEAAEPVEHPFIDRNAEALLLTIQHPIRYHSLERALEDVLCLAAAILQARWNRHREFDQMMIEVRHTRLDRCCHSHLVDAHQQQLGEPELQLLIDHFQELICIGPGSQQPLEIRLNYRVGRERLV